MKPIEWDIRRKDSGRMKSLTYGSTKHPRRLSTWLGSSPVTERDSTCYPFGWQVGVA